MTAIIIEDEKLSAEHLQTLLKKIDKSIEITGIYDSVKSTLAAFEKGDKADVLFVDIHLADGLSFDIFSKLSIDTPIIFTTAYDEYAIKAFKVNSIDYLLKPIGLSELKAAIEKFQKLQSPSKSNALAEITKVYENINKVYKTRFMVKMGENIVSVKSDEVGHFIAEEGIVLLVNKIEKRYAIDYTLDQLEACLDQKTFFRINRKVIVNINAIQKISTYFNSRLKIASLALKDDDCIVSRERVTDFK
ncbi:MAG: LytTR family DNA-binding domain-containing protein, partial [Bacteroidota bacterium]